MDMLDEMAVKQADACVILCGVWAVWTERNVRVHGETTRTIQQSVKWATDIAVNLSQTGKQQRLRPVKHMQSWQPPKDPFIKINVDASFLEETHQGGTGLGVRNHEGTLIRAQALWYESGLSAMVMEAYAVRDGVQLAYELGYRKVIIETDAKLVVDQWKTPRVDRSEISTR
ncbi:uncharacterized protein [Aegilops tauschii subsp. strangulata]|uniref:uncharacterized protein n=1 Tax=Aegilops tauschii subsp. strangulata TaxID=200361 RepID=UPI003CC87E03